MAKRALILGIGGQDGSYLCDILLEQGREVHGLYHRSSYDNLQRIAHCRDRIILHRGDITDLGSVEVALNSSLPDEVYNVADQDHIGWSLKIPSVSWDVTAKAPAMILELLKDRCSGRKVRFFQPVSSTIFGDAQPPQDEGTPLNPLSPYAVAKAAIYHASRYYRRVHGMFVVVGIMYNHDSPRRRNEGYLLHEICGQVKAVQRGEKDHATVGSKKMVVSLGYARDYMEAAVAMLRVAEPDDYVVASPAVTIEELVRLADPGVAVNEDPRLLRPGPQPSLVGDWSKARASLGWSPRMTTASLVRAVLEITP
jgi:GDPmannose 4,6-dehydratase